jgi:hypothetical protein
MANPHDPAIVGIVKFFLACICVYGSARLVFEATGSNGLAIVMGIVVLIGLAIWESDQMEKRRRS